MGEVLRRLGLGQLPQLTTRPPIVRYERERLAELPHIDAKKLGRIVGGIGHRLTGARSRKRRTRPIEWQCLHVAIDDASRAAYAELLPDDSAPSAVACLAHAVAWVARTNGKAERFIQTALRQWASAKPYHSSAARAAARGAYLTSYNTTRPHTAHGRERPIGRLCG